MDSIMFSQNLGGPLITKDRVVVGLVSWGYPCAKGLPGEIIRFSIKSIKESNGLGRFHWHVIIFPWYLDAFTRVYSFLDFINETMTAEYEN